MDELIKAMSNEELKALREKHKANEAVVTLIDGLLNTRALEAIQAKAQEAFEKDTAKLFAKLPHPDAIHNVYASWQEVEEEDPTQEAESILVFNKDGTPTGKEVEDLSDEDKALLDSGDLELECRYPTIKVNKWVVETNKGFSVNRGASGNSSNGASKRAIRVLKREGLTLVDKGAFPSAKNACDYLKLVIGGDSATRVLARDGFIVEPYEGTDYTS